MAPILNVIFLFHIILNIILIFEFKSKKMNSKNNTTATLPASQIMGDWVPRKVVQEFFNYGNTKMSTFATDYNVRISKVGKRIFYKYSDIVKLLNDRLAIQH